MKITQSDIQFYNENGYVLLKNFFSEEEICSFKKGCDLNEHGDTLVRNDFLKFSISDKVLEVVKKVLDSEIIIYPGLSQTRTFDKCQYQDRFYHVDSHPDDKNYANIYNVINTGIYLQDHTILSGGLKIKPKSHRYGCIEVKSIKGYLKLIIKNIFKADLNALCILLRRSNSINIASTERDFLIWNMRTHHSGYYVRLKAFPKLSLPPIIENLIPKYFKQPDPENRRVVISAYAKPGPYTEKWLQQQSLKQRRINHYKANELLAKQVYQDLFSAKNIIYRDDGVRGALLRNNGKG